MNTTKLLKSMKVRVKPRAENGSLIAEFGPAVFIFTCAFFFPFMVVVNLGTEYACAWYLNHMCVRELAVRKQAEGTGGSSGAGKVGDEVDQRFRKSGIAHFIGLSSPTDADGRIKHSVAFHNAIGNGQPGTVVCTTLLKCRPLLPVRGLSKLVAFSMTSERPREELR